ncbi:hypothetical protein AB0K02_23385 [Streptomyces sp. NPDC049597]|uniref:hypothetical protein n=1 Tax=Streptomyces sp. NPDC049597 TaxID=3155276 RepID=UPI003431D630
MAGAQARLSGEGVSLWLTDWKTEVGGAWSARRLMALVGGAPAGHLDFLLHPDGRALSVLMLLVNPQFQRRNLASVMMDALYAAHPTAWIDHGGRTGEGARWWDRYSEPAPERNIHNRPPSEWATYFDAVQVAADKAQNVYTNRFCGLDGHREAEYRYDEDLEAEAQTFAASYRAARVQGPDPAVDDLYGGLQVALPPGLHRLVHDSGRDAGQRAQKLLEHLGHGNLPADAAWNSTERATFDDLAHDDLLEGPSATPGTHLAFHVLPLSGEMPEHHVEATWVRFYNSPGVPVRLAAMSWREAQRPWVTHRADFTIPWEAAIAPTRWQEACAEYRARYNELGKLRPDAAAEEPHPYAGREAEIRAAADKLMRGREDQAAPPPARSAPAASQEQTTVHQSPAPLSPRLR